MRIRFEQIGPEYPVANVRFCSDTRDDRQNVMMMACATWAVEAGHEAEVLWDPRELETDRVDLVFFALFSVAAYRLKATIDSIRARHNCKVVVCGPHAVSFPAHCIRAGADAVVGRCSRPLFLGILNDAERGELRQQYNTAEPIQAFPDHARFRELGFIPEQGFMNALASTGCPYTCAFCSDAETAYAVQTPAAVAQNVATGGEPLVIFNDPTLGLGPAGRELLSSLARIDGRYFISFTTSSMLRHAEFRRALSAANWVMVEVGIENVNTPFAKNRGSDFASVFADCDFLIVANYIYGYDQRDFSPATSAFLRDLVDRCPNVIPSVFVPFSLPETPLYAQHVSGNRIFDDSYMCIGNEILSMRVPGVASPHAYYERLLELNEQLYEGQVERIRGWIDRHSRIDDRRKQVLSDLLRRHEREGDVFDEWVERVTETAPGDFRPFASEVLQSAVPGFERYDLAL